MTFMRNRRHLPHSLALLSACALVLASLGGCGQRGPEAQVVREGSDQWADVPLKAYPIGQPFELEGCTVKLHRVAVGGRNHLPDVTLATAVCPTAEVSAQTGTCGKNCHSDAVQVKPKSVT